MTVLYPGQTASKEPITHEETDAQNRSMESHTLNMEGLEDQAPDLSPEGQARTQQYLQQRYGMDASQIMSQFMFNQQGVGTAPHVAKKFKDSDRSMIEQRMNGNLIDDELPEGPGFTYFNHLFNRAGGKGKDNENKRKKMTKGSNIYTEAQEALKVAIKAMGVATSMNPTGLPVDIQDAMQIWFGDDDVSDDEKLQWRTQTEMGDARIDPKKVRKFTNYDGSMTWEILNDDKTVSSRFTLGEYAGTKVFSQGGYNKFVELMQKVKDQVGYDDDSGFDAVRGKY